MHRLGFNNSLVFSQLGSVHCYKVESCIMFLLGNDSRLIIPQRFKDILLIGSDVRIIKKNAIKYCKCNSWQ